MTDHVEIRPETALSGDKEALRDLFDMCFPGEEGFSKWYFNNIWQCGNTLVIRRANEIVSALQMLPTEAEYKGERIRGCYIFAVGTHPEHEGMGYAGALLRRSFEICSAGGLDFSALIVQRHSLLDYYSRFGYERLFSVQRITLTPCKGSGKIVELGKQHTDLIDRIYRADTEDIFFDVRGEKRWHGQMSAYKVLGYEKNGKITSYCFADHRGGSFFAAEACGPDAGELVRAAAYEAQKTDCQMLTVPGGDGKDDEITGCFMAFSDKARRMRSRAKRHYLNLYYN